MPELITGGLTLLGWGLLLAWCWQIGPVWLVLRHRWLKPSALACPEPEVWPLLSVVFAARDEGAKIRACLESLLRSDYPRLEIIAVNDRSRDDTGRVMDEMAARDSRVRVIHISELPAGWLGKCHGLHTGARQARGEWVLFTDGDVVFQPESLRLSLRYVLGQGVDHLCQLVEIVPGKYWENVLSSYFAFCFMMSTRPWFVGTSMKKAYAGVGAFNLVRRSAYDAVGGHGPLRLEVIDDIKLGKLMKRNGYRQAILLSGEQIRVRWQDSLWGVVRGLEKNAFASMDYSVATVFAVTLLFSAVTYLPYIGAAWLADETLFAASFWQHPAAGYLAAVLFVHLIYGYVGHKLKMGWWVTPFLIVGNLLFMLAIWRSMWITLRQGGVRWRDTFYPLEELRRHQYH